MAELLNLTSLSVQYQTDSRGRNALNKVSLAIPSTGITLGVVGESGSGKTTLGMSIMNLIEPPGKITEGKVEYMGTDVLEMDKARLRKFRWKEVSMIYQSAMNSLNPVKSVTDHIVEVYRQHTDISKRQARELAVKLLTEVGIKSERADSFPHELSGGMKQRAVIAMALALGPKLLIADEPTSALDVVVQKQILGLLKKEVARTGLSLIFITHEIALLTDLVDQIAVMFAGEIVERGERERVLFTPLHPYTESLLRSLLSIDSSPEVLTEYAEITRESRVIPDIGCKFANRCIYALERCRVERPELKQVGEGRLVACHKFN
jgi:peptide/nickel transport system ATP-binding protein